MSRDKVRVDVGGDHPFWDVYPTDDAYEQAEVDREDMSSISVEVEEDGTVRFNNGYEPGSDPYGVEKTLYDYSREDIVHALVEEIGDRFANEPRYAAFLEQNRPAAPRA